MSKLKPQFDISHTEVLARESCYQGFLRMDKLQLRHRLFAGGWSETMTRELMLRGQAVGVLLFDPDREEIVLVRQFRVGMIDEPQSPWLLEIVAGMVDAGEELLEVATRESLEEANVSPRDLVEICSYYNSPGASNEKITLYCGRVDARNAGGIYGLAEEHEDIEVVSVAYEELITAVATGEVNNAMTIIALQWLQLNRQNLMGRWK
jgi:ADP-ribose pyrophosphatase